MSNNQQIRVHLRQIIMVGHGSQARFAKVLTGIRQHGLDERLSNGEQLVAVTIDGYIAGGNGQGFHVTEIESHVHLLAGDNILSIENMALAPNHSAEELKPWQAQRIHTQPCTWHRKHEPHVYRPEGPRIRCPGFPNN